VKQLNVYEEGKKIRESDAFSPAGVNVNFVEVVQEALFVRTYERGVEDETLSCGTGVTAAAIAAGHVFEKNEWQVKAPGGDFLIHFKRQESAVSEVWLHGPAVLVFGGSLTIN
jgi:diaminopimelate epimerase